MCFCTSLHLDKHTHVHVQGSSRDEENSYHCCKNCHRTVSLHCNYRTEKIVHYFRTNVSRVGRQKQKGPEPTTLNYLTVTHKSASEGCWADRVNLPKCMLFTDPVDSELRLCPEGSKGKGDVRYFSSWIVYYSAEWHYYFSSLIFCSLIFFAFS